MTEHVRGPAQPTTDAESDPSVVANLAEPDLPECYDDVCITCSDEAVPVRVDQLLGGGLALVDTGSSREEVSVALVDAEVGDTILVHAKEAIQLVQRG